MQVYRIARANRRYDLSGYGAFLVGGRWNLPGKSLLYTAETRALAMLEVLVQLPAGDLPDDMYLLTLEVPEAVSREEIVLPALPADWQRLTQPLPTAALGHAWLQAGRTLALRVPSVLVPPEHNMLLNPAHPEFAQVQLAAEPEPFFFDERLRK